MRNQPLFIFLFFLFFISCKKEGFNADPSLSPEYLSPAPPIQTPDFDWENATSININGANRTLPWIGGSPSSLPAEVMSEMTSANGWELLYNFIGYPASGDNQKYLIFHNKFTGIMRSFCYNTNSAAINTQGIFQLKLEGDPTNMLHLTQFINQGQRVKNPSSVHTVVTKAELSGFRPEWNCFDIPFTYDPNITANSNLKFSIYTDARDVSDFTVAGTFNSETTGELITTTSSNPLSGIANAASKKSGELAKKWLKDKIQNGSSKSPSNNSILNDIITGSPDLLGDLVQSGVSKLFSFFIGGFGGSGSTSQTINLYTEGKMNASGQILTNFPGSINSINAVVMPGTNQSDGGILPIINHSLGSWGLANNPVVYYDRQAVGSGTSLTQFYSLSVPASDVVLNPAIIDVIDHYTVSSELWFYKKYQGVNLLPYNTADAAGVGQTMDLWTGSVANGELMYQDAENILYRNVSKVKIFNENIGTNQPTYLNGYVPGFVAKVTVTLYPKAPYNTNPIIMTRSYLPTYE